MPAHPRCGYTIACGSYPERSHLKTGRLLIFPPAAGPPGKYGFRYWSWYLLVTQTISFHCIAKVKTVCWHVWELIQNTSLSCLSPLKTSGEEPLPSPCPHPTPFQILYQSFVKKLQWGREIAISEMYYTLKQDLPSFDIQSELDIQLKFGRLRQILQCFCYIAHSEVYTKWVFSLKYI